MGIPEKFRDKVEGGHVSSSCWPEEAYFVVDDGSGPRVEKVVGWQKIQRLAREDDEYLNQYHGTSEAAEEYIEMTYHPVEHAHKQFKAGLISQLELHQRVGDLAAKELIDRG